MGWHALMDLSTHSIDDVQNGSTYGRVQIGDLTNGRIDIDKVQEGTTNRFLTSSEKSKLSGIATGAQVNEVTGSNIIAKINASVEDITVDDEKIPNLTASKITSGTLGVDRIPGLPAGKITSGSFSASRIPGLDASKITSGQFGVARLKIDNDINVGQHSLQNFKLESGTTFPSAPVEGQVYRKDGILYVYKSS